MSNKLHCTAHDVRVMVLDTDGSVTTVHRSNGERCATATVAIGNNVIPVREVLAFGKRVTLNSWQAMQDYR